MTVIGNFCGFETQGNEEASATSGSPTYDGTVRGAGASALVLDGGTDEFALVSQEVGTGSPGGNPFIVQFYFRTSSTSLGSSFIAAIDDAGGVCWFARIQGTGAIRVTDANSTNYDSADNVLVFDTWHKIQIIWNESDSGNFDLWVDGVSEISSATFDGNTPDGFQEYHFNSNSGHTRRFDDVITMHDATSAAADFLDNWSIKKYQAKGTGLTENGATLDNGTWDAAGDTPLVEDADGTAPEYNGGGAQTGDVTTDAGSETDIGPNTDTDVDTIVSGKWVHRMKRGNGSGTTHGITIGNDVDGIVGVTKVIGTGYGNFMEVRTGFTTPETDEHFRCGFRKGAGGREIFCAEMWNMLLFTPPVAGHAGGKVNSKRLVSKVHGGLVG